MTIHEEYTKIIIERGVSNKKGKHICPVCGEYEFEESGSYDICEVCGWEDDPIQEKDPDYKGGANKMSLNEAKERSRRVCKIIRP